MHTLPPLAARQRRPTPMHLSTLPMISVSKFGSIAVIEDFARKSTDLNLDPRQLFLQDVQAFLSSFHVFIAPLRRLTECTVDYVFERVDIFGKPAHIVPDLLRILGLLLQLLCVGEARMRCDSLQVWTYCHEYFKFRPNIPELILVDVSEYPPPII